jgi:hypothetical protein
VREGSPIVPKREREEKQTMPQKPPKELKNWRNGLIEEKGHVIVHWKIRSKIMSMRLPKNGLCRRKTGLTSNHQSYLVSPPRVVVPRIVVPKHILLVRMTSMMK